MTKLQRSMIEANEIKIRQNKLDIALAIALAVTWVIFGIGMVLIQN